MGEWKTAWDHIVFEGFLGVHMTLQFTWTGCDSALAAPLVLDLVRLAGARAGPRGNAARWSSWRSSSRIPWGPTSTRMHRQYEMLERWVLQRVTA